jgi:hypothetical protein
MTVCFAHHDWGFAPLLTPDNCRQKAEECMTLAANTADYQRARFCIELAVVWTDMARRREQEQTSALMASTH